jgi:hypothetical protein
MVCCTAMAADVRGSEFDQHRPTGLRIPGSTKRRMVKRWRRSGDINADRERMVQAKPSRAAEMRVGSESMSAMTLSSKPA